MDADSFLCFVCSAIVIVDGGLVFIIWLIHSLGHADKPDHNPHHKGITVNTMFGKKDIICPVCKCADCQYVYEDIKVTRDKYTEKVKLHPFNVCKPFIERKVKASPGQVVRVTKYRCKKCGHIFN